jgi:hypothetical protein
LGGFPESLFAVFLHGCVNGSVRVFRISVPGQSTHRQRPSSFIVSQPPIPLCIALVVGGMSLPLLFVNKHVLLSHGKSGVDASAKIKYCGSFYSV